VPLAHTAHPRSGRWQILAARRASQPPLPDRNLASTGLESTFRPPPRSRKVCRMRHEQDFPPRIHDETLSDQSGASYTDPMSENVTGANAGKDRYLFGALDSSAANRAKVREVS